MVKDRCRGFRDVRELVSLASVYAKPRPITFCTTLLAVPFSEFTLYLNWCLSLDCPISLMHHQSEQNMHVFSRGPWFCTCLPSLQH